MNILAQPLASSFSLSPSSTSTPLPCPPLPSSALKLSSAYLQYLDSQVLLPRRYLMRQLNRLVEGKLQWSGAACDSWGESPKLALNWWQPSLATAHKPVLPLAYL